MLMTKCGSNADQHHLKVDHQTVYQVVPDNYMATMTVSNDRNNDAR